MSSSKESTEEKTSPPANGSKGWVWGIIIVVFILLALFAFQAGWLKVPSLLLSPPDLGEAMLDVHPIFRYLVIQPPKGIQRFVRKSSKADDAFTPLFLGALTVFIPCGVTQAIALLALAAGSATYGALIMFAFVLGTFPIFFVLGLATARLSSAWEGTALKVAAIAILLMGLYSMIAGSGLLGYQIGLANPIEMADSTIVATPSRTVADDLTALTEQIQVQAGADIELGADGYQQITIAAMNEGYQPPLVKLRAGVPARINLVTNETYSCARAFVIPALGVEKILPETGTETIEFTPQAPGSIPFTCSMGIYTGVIEVVANENETEVAQAPPIATQATEMDHQEMTHEAATASQESQPVPPGHGRILLTASSEDRMQAFMMNSDGTVRKLTELGSINDAPLVREDGQRIAFYSNRTGDFNIFTMAADGSASKQLTHDAQKAISPIYSPDGNWIIYGQLGGESIQQIPSTGGEPTTLTTSPEIQALPAGWLTTSHQ